MHLSRCLMTSSLTVIDTFYILEIKKKNVTNLEVNTKAKKIATTNGVQKLFS